MASREINWLHREKKHPSPAAFRKDIKRLKRGEPLAYVIGWVDFLGCKIDLSYRPLIPRPETEFWVEQAIRKIESRIWNLESSKRAVKCLDVFAGSGCIGIAVLKHIPSAKVWFGDNSPACLRQIRKNLKLNKIQSRRYQIRHTNILGFDKLTTSENVGTSFDYILANPPYIPTARKPRLSKSILNYEPHSALFAGKDGLRFIRPLIAQAESHLNPGGELWLEFDSGEKDAIASLAAKSGYQAEFHKDQFGRWRWVVLKA